MKIQDTYRSYKVIEYDGIQYGVCRDYDHISRYRGLRQVTHNISDMYERFIALETPNTFSTNSEILYYEVPHTEVNRLDLIAYKFLGSAQYAWTIAYFNQILDGFTVREGQRIMIPKTFTQLYNKGEILASVNPMSLNLGTE